MVPDQEWQQRMAAFRATRADAHENWVRARAQSLTTITGAAAPLPSYEDAVAILNNHERETSCTETPLPSA